MKEDEQILVVPRSEFGEFIHFKGFKSIGNEPIQSWLNNSSFERRAPMEEDPSYQQIIPYIILRHQELIFRYSRTQKGGESRLHNLFSIGIGGHINPIDEATETKDIVIKGALRELEEELHITQDVKLEHIGYINDDDTEVGKVHFGFVMQAWLKTPDAAVREDALSNGEWVNKENLLDGNEYETWSQLIIQDFLS